MYKLDLAKAEKPEIKLPTLSGSWKKQESSRKTSISASLTMPKPLTVWITINCGKFFKRWEYQTTLPASWETHMQVKKQCNWTWNNRLVHNWERSTSSYILSPYLFNLYAEYILQNARLCESQDSWEKYQQPQICRWYHSNGRKRRGTKSLLMRRKRRVKNLT